MCHHKAAAQGLSDPVLLERYLVRAETSSGNVTLMTPSGRGVIRKFNPLFWGLSGAMYIYQKFVSPQLPSECLYECSCSAFSRELVMEYGLIRGVIFTSDRLLRCNRVAATDIHPLSVSSESGRVVETPGIYRMGK